MNKFIGTLILLSFQAPLAIAQVRLNITFHSIEDIRVNNISCIKKNKDLVIETHVESFATQPSFIRYELLQLEKGKSYQLKHNDSKEFLISDRSPSYLAPIKAGSLDHHFTLVFKETPFSQCHLLKESARMSIEPI